MNKIAKSKVGKKRVGLIALVLVSVGCLVAFLPAGAEEVEHTKGWNHDDFHDNMILTYVPYAPNETQSVSIRIESKEAVQIKNATLHFNVTFSGGNSSEGSWSFLRENETVMVTNIRPYANGTKVIFFVVASDLDGNLTISPEYPYIVIGEVVEGWQHEVFEDNVAVSYIPQRPQGNQMVIVKIVSKEENVTIAGANLYVKYRLRGQSEQTGGFPFNIVNSSTLVAEIPGYPLGTVVTFWVRAWDKDIEIITSEEYIYTIESYGYEIYGTEEFPQNTIYGAYVAFFVLSILVIFLFVRDLRRKEQESLKERRR